MVKYTKLNFTIILVFVFSFAISGCGKKADPLPPFSQNIANKK